MAHINLNKGLEMNYGTAYNLISPNVSIEKMIADTDKEISWKDLLSYKLNRDCSDLKQWDVYIKVSKQYCPKLMLKNKSLELTNFDAVNCPKSYKCKALGYVGCGGRGDCYAILGPYKCFPKDSKSEMVENIPEYFTLKCTFYNIPKKNMYNMYVDLWHNLKDSCADCLEKKWKKMSVKKFITLNNFKQENQGR